MIKKYYIETKTEISLVRNRIDTLFKETNHILKGKFVGSLKNNSFQGTTNYNTHITVKGKIYQNNEKTIVYLVILDSSPNYTNIVNTLISVFLLLTLIIIAANKSTNYFIYLIPITIFGLAYTGFRLKLFLSKYFRIKLKNPAEFIAKEVNGVIVKHS